MTRLNNFLDGVWTDRYWYPSAFGLFVALTAGLSQSIRGYVEWLSVYEQALTLVVGWMFASGLMGLIKGKKNV